MPGHGKNKQTKNEKNYIDTHTHIKQQKQNPQKLIVE